MKKTLNDILDILLYFVYINHCYYIIYYKLNTLIIITQSLRLLLTRSVKNNFVICKIIHLVGIHLKRDNLSVYYLLNNL